MRMRSREALQLKEKHGGEVVVVCAGPERADEYAAGGSSEGARIGAIHIEAEDLGDRDTLGGQRCLPMR